MQRAIIVLLILLLVPAVQANVKLYIFDCGPIYREDISDFGLSNEEINVRELFVACYLIDHPDGKMIWDAGLPLDLVGPRESGASNWYERSIIDQLSDIGVEPGDIKFAAFSLRPCRSGECF